MIVTNGTQDFSSGGAVGDIKPAFTRTFPKTPEIEMAPFQMRWSQMRLEYMQKRYAFDRDVSRHINPKRGFFEGFVPNMNAQYDYKLVMDGAPARYARVLAAGMVSGLTSPSRPWFKLSSGDEVLDSIEEVKGFNEKAERIILNIFRKSNFYGSAQQTYEELGMFGVGAVGIFEDYNTVIRCRAYTVGEYYFGCGEDGRVNSFARQFWMTADQLVEKFGFDNLSIKAQNVYKTNNRDTWFLVYHLVEQNSTMVPGRKNFKGKPIRSIYWEAASEAKCPLKLEGFNEFPIMGPRWDMTTTADTYGVGPGAFSLGDIKSLYKMKKDLFLGINKQADPPVLIDASVEGVANMLPGGVTRTSSAVPNAGARAAYEVKPDVQALSALIQSMRQDISSNFFADLFMAMIQSDKAEMTAREIVERHEEKLLMLGPVLERIESEFLGPAIDRVFAIALRAGILPPIPKVLRGRNLHVEYISLLAQAQKMVGTAAIEQEAAFVGSLVGVFPEAKDNFDADEAVRAHAEMIGTPQRVIRSKQQVLEIRRQRALQMQAAKEQQDQMAAVQAAKTLSETEVGGGTALGHLLGVGGEQPGVGQPTPGGTA